MLLTDVLSLFAIAVSASPAQGPISIPRKQPSTKYFDIQVAFRFPVALLRLVLTAITFQAHRGGRGNTIENTLPSFAWFVSLRL
jgi:hypothetical protein